MGADLELAQQLVAAGQRLVGRTDGDRDVVEERLVRVRRPEDEPLIVALDAAAEAHPVL
ncbi:MAG TPA: hypothetical protein VMY78_04390 [Solirubrobacteraceae bacterium]|nr:hypothetical protein [Solirubrobacteraceae bacterium]